ncbi:hypothetical protein GQ457_07G012090 [Hibiscus cannabinus]
MLIPSIPKVTVSSMVDVTHGCNWHACAPYLLIPIIHHLAAILPPRPDTLANVVGWKWTVDHTFTVKSAYELRMGMFGEAGEALWKLISHFKGLPQIRIYLWLVAKGRILTNVEQVRRHMTDSAACSVCGHGMESIDHVLWHCPSAVVIWLSTLKINLSHSSYFGVDWLYWDLSFGSIVWILWKFRNICAFDPISKSDFQVWSECCRAYEHCLLCISVSEPIMCNAPAVSQAHCVCWQPPTSDWLKLNTDGSRVSPEGFASCGGIVRNDNGEWIVGFSKYVGIYSIVVAELWGVFEGLALAWTRGFRKILLEVDSLDVFRLLTRHGADRCFDSLTCDIHELLDRHWEVSVGIIRHSTNQVANGLAKVARVRTGPLHREVDFSLRLFLAPPDELVSLVHNDLLLTEDID